MQHRLVKGFFDDSEQAQKAVEQLRAADFRAGDIYLVNTREIEDKQLDVQSQTTTLRLKTRSPGRFMAVYALVGLLLGGVFGAAALHIWPWVSHLLRHDHLSIVICAVLGLMFATIIGALFNVDAINADTAEIDGLLFPGLICICVEPEDPSTLAQAKSILSNAGGKNVATTHDAAGKMGRLKTFQFE